jgi:hypothetical protein
MSSCKSVDMDNQKWISACNLLAWQQGKISKGIVAGTVAKDPFFFSKLGQMKSEERKKEGGKR